MRCRVHAGQYCFTQSCSYNAIGFMRTYNRRKGGYTVVQSRKECSTDDIPDVIHSCRPMQLVERVNLVLLSTGCKTQFSRDCDMHI